MTTLFKNLFLGAFVLGVVAVRCGAAEIEFNRDVRPILADACFHCHGPDPGTRKAGLRLDTEAGLFSAEEGEPPTVVKGKPADSSLYQRLITPDEDEVMPPPKSHKELKPEQIALLKEWIEQGALWQPHWSLVAPRRPSVPVVKDKAWPKTPIDYFVLAKLEQAGLPPAPEADAHTLVRRLTLDLTGLPPSQELLNAYTQSEKLTDVQISRLADELMKLPAYGEHRARYWLDAARYGDTHGVHMDNYREMWPYRDWVVRAFNSNQPFDQFTIEQIAGDLLPNPTTDQLIATGFQRCNITTNEGGTIDEENLANYAADRVQTLGWVYFGLTTNCAQCHDHKFDPITMRDYYSLAAFFRNTTQKGKDGNHKDGKGPYLVIPSDSDKERWQALPKEISVLRKQWDERKKESGKDFEKWLASAKPETAMQSMSSEALTLHAPLNHPLAPPVARVKGGKLNLRNEGEVKWQDGAKFGSAPEFVGKDGYKVEGMTEVDKSQPFTAALWLRLGEGRGGNILSVVEDGKPGRGWELAAIDSSLEFRLFAGTKETELKVKTRSPVLKRGKWQHVAVIYDGAANADSMRIWVDAKRVEASPGSFDAAVDASLRIKAPLSIGGTSLQGHSFKGAIQEVRLYNRILREKEMQNLAGIDTLRKLIGMEAAKRTAKDLEALADHFLTWVDTPGKALSEEVFELESQREAIQARSAITHIQEEVKGAKAMAHILERGAYDKPGEAVAAAIPAALGKLPKGSPANRLGLAHWLVSRENPLTARVTVNRMWQELFGQGLVKTPEDFGIMGAVPSHPELLDWLAVEFQEGDWDVKKLIKILVTSAVYRQSAIATEDKLAVDRDNAHLSRGPRFRMDAEMLRDYALSASGLLSRVMGGPGLKPYQPADIWNVVGLPSGNTRLYVQDSGEKLYRRSLYTFWKRMAPPPNMEALNAPSREVCNVRRERTNTPIQALVTLNDPQFVEAARKVAEGALACGCKDDGKALAFVAKRILCRALDTQEAVLIGACLKDLRAHYAAHPEDANVLLKVGASPPNAKLDPSDLAAWTMLVNQIFNLDEVLNK